MSNTQENDSKLVYEEDILIKGKVSVLVKGDPKNPGNIERMSAILMITFYATGPTGKLLPLTFRHVDRISELSPFPIPRNSPDLEAAVQSRASMWGRQVKSFFETASPVVLNNMIPLAMRWIQAKYFKATYPASEQRRDVDLVGNALDRIIGTLRDSPQSSKTSGKDKSPEKGN